MVKLLTMNRKVQIGEAKHHKKGFPFYEVYSDGIYVGINNGVMVAKQRLLEYKEGKFPLVQEGETGFKLQIPKIPFKYWEMIWSFYRDVNKNYGTEATVLLYWDFGKYKNVPKELEEDYGDGIYKEGKLILYVPQQRNYGGLTEYNGDEMRKWLGENTSVILDTHSHNSMNAFFSATDDANEKNYQLYAVYGKVGEENQFVMRYRFMGEWYGVALEDIFEGDSIGEGNITESTYPIKWYNQCQFKTEEEVMEC